MKINFCEKRFKELLTESKDKKISIPNLINKILDKHYNYSYEGVEQNGRSEGKTK